MQAGLNSEEAHLLTDCMLVADLRGIGSHGISRLRTYSNRVKSGVISSGVTPKIISESNAAVAVDGMNGVGPMIGKWMMDLCVQKAKEHGSCFATAKHGNHFGIGAYYTMQAAQSDMIGIAMCNCEASVVPYGGAVPMLGTNPLSVALPAKKHPNYVLDMATSVVARGRIVLAQKKGEPIPADWAVDKNGAPTSDPDEAFGGALLPFGGAKGYAIGLLIDILCSCLAGALDCRKTNRFWDDFVNPQDSGFFMGAFDISKFVDIDIFKQKVDTMFDEFKSCPPAPGFKEVMIPGEIEHLTQKKNEQEGIGLSDAVVRDLCKLAEEYKLSHLFG